jgi:putative MFS transporter
MFERLDATRSLTANQRRIVVAAILGDMLEFFDYFLIGFVLAFIVGPWELSFGQSTIILLSSGIGAMLFRQFMEHNLRPDPVPDAIWKLPTTHA